VETVEVYADVWCPFAHVGLRRLVQHRDRTGAGFVIRARAWPLELINGRPLDAALVAEEVDAIRRQVAPDLFAGFDPDRFPRSTLPALRLAAAAYDRDVESGERVSLLLRDALFEHGRDIGRRDELQRVADAAGVPGLLAPVQAVTEEWREGRRRGVVGSPHFFVAGADFFCPSLDIRRVGDHLEVAADPAGLEELVALVA
jgi:predicted DsbA family dithiol-disulfide isomerase